MAGTGADLPRLAAVIQRQERELARVRAEAADAALVAMARGALMERHGCSAAEAARQLAEAAAAAHLPVAEMAAAVLGQQAPERAGPAAQRSPAAGQADALNAMVAADTAVDGTELVAALAGQVGPRFGVTAVAVWLLVPDGSLEMIGQAGLDGTSASRWHRLPPQLDCPEQRAAAGGAGLWWPDGPPGAGTLPVVGPGRRDAARVVLPVRGRAGNLLGVAEFCWPAPRRDFDPSIRDSLPAAVAGFAEVLRARVAAGTIVPPLTAAKLTGLLTQIVESALVARPVRGPGGELEDFTIAHLSPGYADPAGRPAAELAGLTLLEAYPASVSGNGLFARAERVLASGRAEHVRGSVIAPLTGTADAVDVTDLHIAPFFDGVICVWRRSSGSGQLAELLENAQRLGYMGAWEENLTTGVVRWTRSAFELFGLDPERAVPIPTADLHSFVIAADRPLVRQFQRLLLQEREPRLTVFRIVRPGDTSLRQIRIFAEPVVSGGDVVALRGGFQDVSAHYHTQVALDATREQLADIELRAAEEHKVALMLQRAIMPEDAPPVHAAGVEVAVRYRPAEEGHLVAGDWYDSLVLPSKELLLVVGDITGHGIQATTGMVAARNALRGLAMTGAGPAELLRHLNYAACHLGEGMAGTVICGLYDPGTRVLRWARAGHLPPVLVRDGTGVTLPLPDGVLLGLAPDAEYEEATLPLRRGDSLLLFTDGLIERRKHSISDALREFAAMAVPADTDVSAHADRILGAAASDTADDACLVAVRIL